MATKAEAVESLEKAQQAFSYTVEEGVAVVTFDLPSSP